MPKRRPRAYPLSACTGFVHSIVPWVPRGWGDAVQWPAAAHAAGLVVCVSPVEGALAVWAQGPSAGPAGHVAVVVKVDQFAGVRVWDRVGDGSGRTEEYDLGAGFPAWYIHPPADTRTRLSDGPFDGGVGARDQNLANVNAAWGALVNYWGSGAYIQSLQIEVMTLQFNRLR